MSTRSSTRVPKYRLHKPSGLAVVTLSGRDRYLGRHGSPESKAEYERLIAEWLQNGRRPPDGPKPRPAVADVIASYWRHLKARFTSPDAATQKRLEKARLAMRPLARLYGHTEAAEFGPRALQVVQRELVGELQLV